MQAKRKLKQGFESHQQATQKNGALPGSLTEFLASKSECYAQLKPRQRAILAGFLFAHDMKTYRHRDDEQLQCLHFYILKLAFRGRFHEVNAALGWFIVEREADHRNNSARGWAVTEKAEALIEEFAFSDAIDRGLIDWQGRPMRKPRSAFAPMTTSGTKSRFRGSKMQAHITIDPDGLVGLVRAGYAWRNGEECPDGYDYAYKQWDEINLSKNRTEALRRIRRSIIQARNLIHLAMSSSPSAFTVPVVYHEVASGRVHAEGLTPQGCTREVKRASLRGCYEYDMENAHWTFLYQLAKRINPKVELPEMEAYLKAKPFYRKRIADHAGITTTQAKEVLLSLIFGAHPNSQNPKSTIPKIVGKDNLPALRNAVRLLCKDMNKAKRMILEHYETESRRAHRKNVLVNDAGRIYRAKDAQENEAGSKLAHILQGLESVALKACIDVCGDDIALLQHDGFACRNRADVEALRRAIFDATGIDIELDEKLL